MNDPATNEIAPAVAPVVTAVSPAPKPTLSFWYSPSVAAATPLHVTKSFFKQRRFTQVTKIGTSGAQTTAKDLVSLGDGTEADITRQPG